MSQGIDKEFKSIVMDEFGPVATHWEMTFRCETKPKEGIQITFENPERHLVVYRDFGDPDTIAILAGHLHRGIAGMHGLFFPYAHDDCTGSSPILITSIRKKLRKAEIGRVPFLKFGDFREGLRAISQYLLANPQVLFPDARGLRKLTEEEEDDE